MNSTRTVEVSNISLRATEQDIKEFFSFSGDIEYVEMKREDEPCQVAYVTFKDTQGAETALLLSGAMVVDLIITITPAPDYQLPPGVASAQQGNTTGSGAASAVKKAEDVVSSMIAKGFILGKGAVNKAKALDEKHQLTSTATSTVVNLDQKIGLSEKLSMTKTVVNDKVKVMDEKFQVSEKTKIAFAAAEQTVANAGLALMNNQYVSSGASWVTGAFNKAASAAVELSQKAKEKVGKTEDEQRRTMVEDYAKVHLSESDTPKKSEQDASKAKPPVEGLIL